MREKLSERIFFFSNFQNPLTFQVQKKSLKKIQVFISSFISINYYVFKMDSSSTEATGRPLKKYPGALKILFFYIY